MKIDSEPSEHGDHMVLLSIKKEKHKRKSRDYSSSRTQKQDLASYENAQFKINSHKKSLRSSIATKKPSEHCHIMHQLQNNFEVFALNNHLNGEDTCFCVDNVITAMPHPSSDPSVAELSHKAKCSFFNQRESESQKALKNKLMSRKKYKPSDGTYFLKESYHNGQPTTKTMERQQKLEQKAQMLS